MNKIFFLFPWGLGFYASIVLCVYSLQSHAVLLAQCKYFERNAGIQSMTLHDFNHYKENIIESNHNMDIYEPEGVKLTRQQAVLADLYHLLFEVHPPKISDLFKVLSAYSVEWKPEFPFADLAFANSTFNFVKASVETKKNTTREATDATFQQPPALLVFETANTDLPIGIGICFNGKVTYLICRLADQSTPLPATLPSLHRSPPLDLSLEIMLMRSLSPGSTRFN